VELMETFDIGYVEWVYSTIASIIGSGINGNALNCNPQALLFGIASIIGSGINGNALEALMAARFVIPSLLLLEVELMETQVM